MEKRGRGRPKSEVLENLRAEWPALSAKASLYNKVHTHSVGKVAVELGLADLYYRDRTTNKRMATKLAIIGQLFGGEFSSSDAGREWLTVNWQTLVEMRVDQVRNWKREQAQNDDSTI